MRDAEGFPPPFAGEGRGGGEAATTACCSSPLAIGLRPIPRLQPPPARGRGIHRQRGGFVSAIVAAEAPTGIPEAPLGRPDKRGGARGRRP